MSRKELTLTIKERRPLGNGNAWTDPSARLGRETILLLYDHTRQLVSYALFRPSCTTALR